jgi:hypothetical protein
MSQSMPKVAPPMTSANAHWASGKRNTSAGMKSRPKLPRNSTVKMHLVRKAESPQIQQQIKHPNAIIIKNNIANPAYPDKKRVGQRH